MSVPIRSATGPAPRPAPRPASRPVDTRERHLRALPEVREAPRVRRAGRGAFALVVTGLLVAGLVGMLLINTLLAQGAFQITALRSAQSSLLEQEQQLAQNIAEQAAPANLTVRARALGMVPVRTAVFLQLPDGTVLGRVVPALPSYAVATDTTSGFNPGVTQ